MTSVSVSFPEKPSNTFPLSTQCSLLPSVPHRHVCVVQMEWEKLFISYSSLPFVYQLCCDTRKLNWCRHCNANSWNFFVLIHYIRILQTRPSQHQHAAEGQNHPIALLFCHRLGLRCTGLLLIYHSRLFTSQSYRILFCLCRHVRLFIFMDFQCKALKLESRLLSAYFKHSLVVLLTVTVFPAILSLNPFFSSSLAVMHQFAAARREQGSLPAEVAGDHPAYPQMGHPENLP